MQTDTFFLSVGVYVGLIILSVRAEIALLHSHMQNVTDSVFFFFNPKRRQE